MLIHVNLKVNNMLKMLLMIFCFSTALLASDKNYKAQLDSFIEMDFNVKCSDDKPENCTVCYPIKEKVLGLISCVKEHEEEKFDEFRDFIKEVYFRVWFAATGSWMEQATIDPDSKAAELYRLVEYTNNVPLEKLPEDVQEVVKRRKEFISAFEHKKMEKLTELLEQQSEKPLWHSKEKTYQKRYYEDMINGTQS